MESYPPTQVTKYGIDLFKEGIEPHISYVSPDGELTFYLNGGLAPTPGVTEGVVLKEGFEGLHPTFQHLDHKGARQDGATWTDTVFDPAQITFDVICTARTPENLRKVIRKWFASWDPEKRGTLSWVTPDSGEWWCHPRLFRSPPNKTERSYARSREQTFTWTIRNDDAFWRSYDSVSQFRFEHNDAIDLFERNDVGDLGPNWTQTYSGPGAGVCETDGHRAVWTRSGNQIRTVINKWNGQNEVQVVNVVGSPTTWKLTYSGLPTANISGGASASDVQTALEGLANIAPGDVSVTGSNPYTVTFTGSLAGTNVSQMVGTIVAGGTNPYVTVATTTNGKPGVTATDNQVFHIQLDDFFEWPLGIHTYFDIWGRMNSASTSGIRCRIGISGITLSAFVGGIETELKNRSFLLPPLWGEKWTLVCGTGTSSRTFKVLRDGFPILTYTDRNNVSQLGASYRGGGFGMQAGSATSQQRVPPTLFKWSMGDNATLTQSGHLNLTNFGDQEAFPDLVVYGPGTFYFGNGPDAEPTITFGPLKDGQVALLKTHPGMRSVYDISTDVSEQDLPLFQNFIAKLISFAFNKNIPPLFQWFESLFGIQPQQGPMYSLLNGRFTKGVPGRTLAALPTTSQISVKIKDGDADSKVVAALTPLRRWPE
jgi:hypothetical protein